LAALSQLIESGVESVSASHLALAYGNGDRREVQRIVDQGIRLAAIPTLAVMLVAIPLGASVLSLLGHEFATGRWVLVLLLAGNAVSACNGPVGFVVSLSGLERLYARVMLGHAVAALGACVLAARFGSVETVALAITLVVLSWNVWLIVIARRRLGICCWPRWSAFRPRAGLIAADSDVEDADDLSEA
jgi:O-antigen/teichoic acid export membrane protein